MILDFFPNLLHFSHPHSSSFKQQYSTFSIIFLPSVLLQLSFTTFKRCSSLIHPFSKRNYLTFGTYICLLSSRNSGIWSDVDTSITLTIARGNKYCQSWVQKPLSNRSYIQAGVPLDLSHVNSLPINPKSFKWHSSITLPNPSSNQLGCILPPCFSWLYRRSLNSPTTYHANLDRSARPRSNFMTLVACTSQHPFHFSKIKLIHPHDFVYGQQNSLHSVLFYIFPLFSPFLPTSQTKILNLAWLDLLFSPAHDSYIDGLLYSKDMLIYYFRVIRSSRIIKIYVFNI